MKDPVTKDTVMKDPDIQASPESMPAETRQFRSQVGHISRNSGMYLAGTMFSVALGYVFKVYLARVLGAEALGIYALGITLVGFFGAFNSLGLVESAVRFAAVYRAAHRWEQLRALLWRGGAILLVANVVFGAILLKLGGVVAGRFYHSAALARYIPWFAALMLLGVISTFYGRILAGYKEVGRRTLITNFIGSPATMLLTILLLHFGWGLRGYLLAQVLGAVLVVVLLIAFVWTLTPAEARLSLHWPLPLEHEVWLFSAAAVGVLLLEFLISQVDKIALGFYRGARAVGIYSVAATVVACVSLILTSVNQVFSPLIADLHSRKDNEMLGRLYRALTKWILGLTAPMAITVIVFARPILRIFGHDFEAGWPILIIGTAGQLVNCGVGSVGLLLLMSGNQRRLLRVQAAMAVVMTVACIALVPIWGIVGAAVAAAITNAGTNLWNLFEVRSVLGLSPFNRSYFRLLIPTIVTVLAALVLKFEAHLFRRDWLAIAVGLLGSYLVFIGMVLAMGLDEDDRVVAQAMWSRVRSALSVEGTES
ncbi:MAG: flippase [Candidatus Sulfotelmatobacter sp.]|jgi:O-antigen/teichoic acid export membrane protein